MIYKIVRYLLQQGYDPKEMVVLTPYLGQLTELKKELQTEVNAVLNELDAGELARAGLLTTGSYNKNGKELRLATIGMWFLRPVVAPKYMTLFHVTIRQLPGRGKQHRHHFSYPEQSTERCRVHVLPGTIERTLVPRSQRHDHRRKR